ncbi:Crp/Fnr family transcriptional regulator [Rhodoferax sp. WC2427]|uniref:Crp/Fnr family transcriptional regulator n=1 Tax=Rhodoferax sp. WC2427 TaxID=3234144 RepID=UPI0034675C0E
MSMLSNIELLLRVPLFSSMTAEQADVVAKAVTKQRFKRAEIIVEQGRKSNALFIVLSGRARVLTTDSRGREVILATLQVGDYVGEMSLIDNEPHSATVQTEIPTDCLVLGRAEFEHCLDGNTAMARAVMYGLVKRLRRADQKIESLALMDVYGRVAHVLLEAATPNGDGQMVIRDKISRQDVAKMVGASREMVSRVMKDLEERGYIEGHDNGSTHIRSVLGSLT